MMPPHCYVCGLDPHSAGPGPLGERFVLVYFADPRPAPEGWTGHPSNAVWFCVEHAALGTTRESLPTATALREIDATIGRGSAS
ncbi:hypothetical protein KZZ52_55410 [Dactylosporangium sp. AC04546]|uniref:hypothetical protein n=1 Tax=Dactylosporangium sp. AC04546 TaxID=2862460 RepID=UPI001EDE3DF8|nr:hypothetical protein [Dactylosporangium sp. AC04546]WVK83019.1 hypothetical protein KZZ52_55410 [Dactylosporangium sp. AC04546]